MDFVGQIAQQLGVDSQQAQGVAGALVGWVQGAVKEKLGPEAAQQVAQAVPESQGWQQAAGPQQQPPAGGLGQLAGALGGMLGGQSGVLGALGGALGQADEAAGLVALLQRFNVGADKAALVAPLLLNFLKSRLDPALVGRILSALPVLAQLVPASGDSGGSGAGGGLGGMIGNLLG